jgi:hypothetical protein
MGARPYKWGTENEMFSHEFTAGVGTKIETKFLMGLKVPDSYQGMETVVFG